MNIFRRHRPIVYILRPGLLFVLLCALVGSLAFFPLSTYAVQPDPAAQVLALVNEWRIQEGLWPLKVNQTLNEMALAQATYIQPKADSITDELQYHLDAQGRTPPERALQSYGWPAYRKSSPKVVPVEIGENAADGSPQFALNFWKSSSVHRKAALSKVYREVGVAALKSTYGYIFIMDFGARPGILPPLVSQSGNTLYIPNENSSFVSLQPDKMQIRLLNADGTPLTDFMPWKARILSTKSYTTPLVVEFVNGTYHVLSNVDPAEDVINASGAPKHIEHTPTAAPTTVEASALPTLTLAASSTSTPAPTLASTSTASPTVAPSATETPTVGPSPTTPPTLTPSAVPSLSSTRPDLLLFYNSRSLVVYNNAGKPVNLTGFSVGGSAGRISVANWNAVAAFSSTAFPAASCLQALQLGATDAAAPQCKFVRSEISVPAVKVFWANGQFTVNRNDTILATCEASAGRCEVRLS